jgi:transposase
MIRLTDEQWERIRDHFPEENIADGRPGRKPTPTRCVLEAVLWMRRRSPRIVGCKRSTRPSWAAGSHASFTMGSRAAAWVGRGSTLGQIAVPVPKNCARSCVPPARAARCSAIEAYSCKSHARAASGHVGAAEKLNARREHYWTGREAPT